MTIFSKILVSLLVLFSQYTMATGEAVVHGKPAQHQRSLVDQIQNITSSLKFLEAAPGTEISVFILESAAKKSSENKGPFVRAYPERNIDGKLIQCNLNTTYETGNNFFQAKVLDARNGSILMEMKRADGKVAHILCGSKLVQSRKEGDKQAKNLTAKEIQDYFAQVEQKQDLAAKKWVTHYKIYNNHSLLWEKPRFLYSEKFLKLQDEDCVTRMTRTYEKLPSMKIEEICRGIEAIKETAKEDLEANRKIVGEASK